VAQIPFFPPVQTLSDFSMSACHTLLESAAGIPLDDLAIHKVAQWSMHAQVAARFDVHAWNRHVALLLVASGHIEECLCTSNLVCFHDHSCFTIAFLPGT
jgi:hypothetical protein